MLLQQTPLNQEQYIFYQQQWHTEKQSLSSKEYLLGARIYEKSMGKYFEKFLI
jgi:hypothetical protein